MIQLPQGKYLADIIDKIPSNCILSKQIPGCGATTLELMTNRNSIIIVPNIPVIHSKCQKYPNLLGISQGVKQPQIVKYLKSHRIHKIMTTPESFPKIKSACKELNIDIHSSFFLLMDECHQLITDVDYREDVVLPMRDFFEFTNKALVSATPIAFSDPRFKENNFKTIQVTAAYDCRQNITVTHTYNIAQAVEEYLKTHTGNICFFFNSVVESYSLIKHFNLLNDAVIYCAPKSRNNLKKEEKFTHAYTKWSAKTMKKYNFFTGRFFTAFDLDLDYKPDLVMITDPQISKYSILDIDTDCIQICGRFRNGINSVTHIYRANPDIIAKSREQVEWEISAHEFAYQTINTLYMNANTKESRFAYGAVLETLPFRKYQYEDFTKNWFAVDNDINNELVKGRYKSQHAIKEWYNMCYYFMPIFKKCRYDENYEKLKIVRSARSVKAKRTQIVQLLSEFEEPTAEYALDYKNEARKIDPFIVDAFDILGKDTIVKLKYSEKKMREQIIISQRKGNMVVELVKNSFTVGNRYADKTIVKKLTEIFEKANIHPEKPITPKMILDYFQAAQCWVKNERGYLLVTALL